MSNVSLMFDKDSYGPQDVITFAVSVDDFMTETYTIQGEMTIPGIGVQLPCVTTTTVSGLYGPFAASGYTIAQDDVDAAVFHATPNGS